MGTCNLVLFPSRGEISGGRPERYPSPYILLVLCLVMATVFFFLVKFFSLTNDPYFCAIREGSCNFRHAFVIVFTIRGRWDFISNVFGFRV